ncbi:S41 family peptidase [Variovorax humicola]|uniref:S41 family peptidase n=1 Tax=Variovorax humicola TaxID=1769758 RepID=A0ABU8VWA3_9BURK
MSLNIRWGVGLVAALALTACGGGGGGGGNGNLAALALMPMTQAPTAPSTPGPAQQDEPIVASSTVAGLCAVSRQGIDPATGAAFRDRAGTLADEKHWVRGWIDETYLWFDEVPGGLLADSYALPVDYFNVLKTPKKTATGRDKDRFHFTMNTADYQSQSVGLSIGYGMELAFLKRTPPRDVRVAFVEPGAAAALAGVGRGVKLLEIDGVDVANGTDTSKLNAGLSPEKAGEVHTFKLGQLDGSTRAVTLTSADVALSPVQNVKAFDTATGRVGYFQFNDHNEPSEAQLIAAINELGSRGIKDLVLDMRYNGGGILSIASELAYMVASREATDGKTFERLLFNSKNPFHLTLADATVPFLAVTQGYSAAPYQQLPQLGLQEVTVLTGPDTCSASESVVNGLRGVGVRVNLIGGATCGKPYAFVPQDNCGTTYFAIQFQGVNQQGFGDYGDGFQPDCTVADDFSHALGDPAEALLAVALTRQCDPYGTPKSKASRQKASMAWEPLLNRSPARQNRLIKDLRQ